MLLMEHSAETSHGGTENGKNSTRLLDLQKLYNTKPTWVSRKGGSQSSSTSGSSALKRKLGSDDQKRVRKKSKKEVLLSSLSSGRKSNKKSSAEGEVDKGRLSREVGKSESGADRKVNGIGGLGGISHNLNASFNIPKRPRDLVGRKKVEVDLRTKQDGTSSSKVSLDDEGGGKLNGNLGGSLLQNGNVDGKLDENGGSEGVSNSSFIAKVKQKKKPDDIREHRSNGSDSQEIVKIVDSHLTVHNNGDASTKKAKRTRKKAKETRTKKVKETKPDRKSVV